jgi:hypothetical protein
MPNEEIIANRLKLLLDDVSSIGDHEQRITRIERALGIHPDKIAQDHAQPASKRVDAKGE